MSKHTPAPWVGDEHGYVWALGGQMTLCVIRGWGHLTGAGAMNLSFEGAIEIQEANKRLICAAPEMLEALQCQRDLEQEAVCTLTATKAKIIEKWLPRLDEHFPMFGAGNCRKYHTATSRRTHDAFQSLPAILRGKAITKALGEDV